MSPSVSPPRESTCPQVEKDVQDVWEAEHDDDATTTATELSGDSDSDATTTATAEGPRPDEVPVAWDNLPQRISALDNAALPR